MPLWILSSFLTFSILLRAEVGFVEPWGKDAQLCAPSPQQSTAASLSIAGKAAEALILFHHRVITQIDGPRSHYRPTSSTYMLQAIRKRGFLRGFLMGCDRLLRENGEVWLYRTRLINGKLYKWDPPPDSPSSCRSTLPFREKNSGTPSKR